MKIPISMTMLSLAFCVCLMSVIMLTHHVAASGDGSCKELNNVNCYVGRNEGNYCNRKDQTKALTRWYYDKGSCRPFSYRGCNGNRNRFCMQESCETRCGKK
ncbi:kunitz-type protease inhibitor 2 [Drosophila albomicans]|uniref:Kunitz-type protease inhibitor 2 n=1 Tax=Drosophila albomicans TaxID=7291 RepID=A0A6P8XE45_DROAB|nr:kunitz-type protease inhibitor 2 [Drosophila albomicans]